MVMCRGICCQTEPIDESERPKKILPYNVWNEANFYYQINSDKYEGIASQLGADPLIASLLDNLDNSVCLWQDRS